VICDRRDYEWAKAKIDQYDLRGRVTRYCFRHRFKQVSYRDLAEWILSGSITSAHASAVTQDDMG
jgi:7-carboxy-7-deazaguanine synthase